MNRIMTALATTIIAGIALAPTANAHHAKDWAPCAYEDGSGQARCIWLASEMGNGKGFSLKIINGGTEKGKYIRISHRKAMHLLGVMDD